MLHGFYSHRHFVQVNLIFLYFLTLRIPKNYRGSGTEKGGTLWIPRVSQCEVVRYKHCLEFQSWHPSLCVQGDWSSSGILINLRVRFECKATYPRRWQRSWPCQRLLRWWLHRCTGRCRTSSPGWQAGRLSGKTKSCWQIRKGKTK